MKNQYNVIKDLVDSGIWVQVKDLVSGEYALFTEEGSNTLWHSGWYKSIEKSKYTENIRTDFDTASCLNTLNLEIVEYFRPNDLFPSKPFTGGTKVEVSIDDYKGMEFEVLESEETSDMGLFYRLWLAKTQQSFIFSASYVYPRIEKQEEVKKPQDIIGEASVKALEEQGYTITKK